MKRVLQLMWFVALLATVLGSAGRVIPMPDLFSHFPFYQCMIWAVLGVLTYSRSRKAAVGALVLAVLHAGIWAQPMRDHSSLPLIDPVEVRVLWANVHHRPEYWQRLRLQVETFRPHILALAEVDGVDSFAGLSADYPFALRTRTKGLVMFSKIPLFDAQEILVVDSRPILSARIEIDGRWCRILSTHVPWPTLPGHAGSLDRLGEICAAEESCLLLGDFNTTPWAVDFDHLLDHGGLRQARQGSWPIATWSWQFGRFLRLPLDHLLYKGRLVSSSFEIGPEFGSDHLPLHAIFNLGRGPSPSARHKMW
jgi:endonuclease/exonuclease/phosphatase (EEP) superfamily protein YafD